MEEIRFFGIITAGITHEFKNVLAIIKETSGLMEDYLSMCEKENFKYYERYIEALKTIQDQINRGLNLTHQLNQFAHNAGDRITSVNLDELIEQLVVLSQRFARLKGTLLRYEPSNNYDFIETSPLQLQRVLFTILEFFWNQLPSGEIHIKSIKSQEQCRILISYSGNKIAFENFHHQLSPTKEWLSIQDNLEKLSGHVKWDNSTNSILLIIPEKVEI